MSNILEDMQSAVIKEAASGKIAQSRRIVTARRVYALQSFAGATVVTALMLVSAGTPGCWLSSALLMPATFSLVIELGLAGDGKRDVERGGGVGYALDYVLSRACWKALTAKLGGRRWAAMGRWWAAFVVGLPVFAVIAALLFLLRVAAGADWPLIAIGAVAMVTSARRVRTLTALVRAIDAGAS
ncbi:hypothetical protein [Acidithiobacillus ferriphilus]|uniref:Uncharacterized protein n=5 Tax=Acidithiobacillus ferriphilus TaxID=1689834 RepID=A0ABU6FTD2_9PROT|nr:hypothetical protein [Acidithiobacillus ferriphilus]MEB8494703.1 hypothetical protein [Acidithiobacillus ferriphilus]MEB8515172.1 hypothetical protein [Acidithiobacillus ferriphilus]MEB8522104.1 hypothetical protein [Acidithiobacillus ferriphilus]MEB8531958.1 hypothetical protein [Acidithiobacillus ferriphilus]MEB8556958.1 hypothetical protein [Acidithiobacillus ferriphilus]